MAAFLNFCRLEKGLADNSLAAYSADLRSLAHFSAGEPDRGIPGVKAAGRMWTLYINPAWATARSRGTSTLRNFYRFLLREGRIGSDPTSTCAPRGSGKRFLSS